jgi:hypothetical protein
VLLLNASSLGGARNCVVGMCSCGRNVDTVVQTLGMNYLSEAGRETCSSANTLVPYWVGDCKQL